MLSAQILEILEKPKNVGQMRDADGVGKTKGNDCHDFSKLFVKFENRKVAETRFQTYGGPVSIAAVSVVSELVKGKNIEGMLKITLEDVLEVLGGVDEEYLPCVQNALDLIPSCISNFYRKEDKKSEAEEKPAKEAKPAKEKKAPKAKAEKKAEEKPAEEVKPEKKAPKKEKKTTTKTETIVILPEASKPAEEVVEEKVEEPKAENTQTITVIQNGEKVDGENLDIFSEIDAITAKISEAVNKIKKDDNK